MYPLSSFLPERGELWDSFSTEVLASLFLIMAKRKQVRKQHAVLEGEGTQELVGIGLIIVGVLLFISLLRFTPVDFVDWAFVGSFAPEGAVDAPTKNLIGPVGALLGFVFLHTNV